MLPPTFSAPPGVPTTPVDTTLTLEKIVRQAHTLGHSDVHLGVGEAPEAVPDISVQEIEVSPYVPDVRLTDERGNQLIK